MPVARRRTGRRPTFAWSLAGRDLSGRYTAPDTRTVADGALPAPVRARAALLAALSRPWRTGSSADATAEAAPSALPLELSRTRGPRPGGGVLRHARASTPPPGPAEGAGRVCPGGGG
ncbi:hypothetical protein [Streptomyces atratus]|uniref:hypothetical protein n=1 Tax=Streptomyces atratus TaxID=1893 RepID=UPI00365F7A18